MADRYWVNGSATWDNTAGTKWSTTSGGPGGASVPVTSDNCKIIYCTSNSAVTITTATGLGAGFNCTIIQAGTGKVTLAQGASTTLSSYSSLLSTAGQYAVISVVSPSANVFVAAGNLGV